jgi:hypothetical protein
LRGGVPTRNELIQKMVIEKRGHDQAIKESQLLARSYKILGPDLEELYRAATAGVCTCICGGRNFLTPAVAAILSYVINQGWNGCKIWKRIQHISLSRAISWRDVRFLHAYFTCVLPKVG